MSVPASQTNLNFDNNNLKNSIHINNANADTNPATPEQPTNSTAANNNKGQEGFNDILEMISDTRKKIFALSGNPEDGAALNANKNNSNLSTASRPAESFQTPHAYLADSYAPLIQGATSTTYTPSANVATANRTYVNTATNERDLSPETRRLIAQSGGRIVSVTENRGPSPLKQSQASGLITSSSPLKSSYITSGASPIRGRVLTSETVVRNGSGTPTRTYLPNTTGEVLKRSGVPLADAPVAGSYISSTTQSTAPSSTVQYSSTAPMVHDTSRLSEAAKKILGDPYNSPLKPTTTSVAYGSPTVTGTLPAGATPTNLVAGSPGTVLVNGVVRRVLNPEQLPAGYRSTGSPVGVNPNTASPVRQVISQPGSYLNTAPSEVVKRGGLPSANSPVKPAASNPLPYKVKNDRLAAQAKQDDENSMAVKAFIIAMIVLFVALLISQVIGLDEHLWK